MKILRRNFLVSTNQDVDLKIFLEYSQRQIAFALEKKHVNIIILLKKKIIYK